MTKLMVPQLGDIYEDYDGHIIVVIGRISRFWYKCLDLDTELLRNKTVHGLTKNKLLSD